jgi:PAS domain S-box-containing protein
MPARRIFEQTRTDALDRLARLAAQIVGARYGEIVLDAGGRAETAGALTVPIVTAEGTIGTLSVRDEADRVWSDEERRTLAAVADAAAGELEVARMADGASQVALRLDLGYAAAEIGSFDWDLVTDELRWDERLIELFGYTKATFVPHIDTFTQRVHPDDRSRVESAIGRAVDTCGEYATEYRVVVDEHTTRWIAARGRALAGPDGRAERLLGAAFDTTAAHDANERVARLLETMSDAFYSVDREWTFTYVNLEAERLLGRGRDELVGRSLWDEFPAALDSPFETHYRAAMESGTPVSFEAFYPPLDGWYELRAWPTPDGLSVFFHEITARRIAEDGRARALERLELLTAAGSALTSTLDVAAILRALEELLVPRFGSWLAVAVRDDVAALLRDEDPLSPTRLEIARASAAVRGTLLGLDAGAVEGEAARAVRQHVRRALRAAGMQGDVHVVPIVSREQTLGALVLGGPIGDEGDRRLLEDIATRASAALENALLYGAERRAGTALQHLLLPSDLPQLPGIESSARYIAGTTGRLVGGDFYLGHELADGRLLFVIGDVMGHGMEAAARMGQLRAVLTAFAFDGDPPDVVLERVAARAEDLLDVQMATVLVLLYDPAQRTLTAASAGHLPPLIAPLDRPPEFLELTPGPPIGVGAASYPCCIVDLPPATTVVLYTDGLVERRDEHLDAGLRRLRGALLDIRLPPDRVCDHVLEELGRRSGAPDDVALLVFSHR